MAWKRYSAEARSSLLSQFGSWQGSVSGFARHHGLSYVTLRRWLKAREASGPVLASFEAIEPPAAGVESGFRVQYKSLVLHFEQLPSAGWLSDFVRGLGL